MKHVNPNRLAMMLGLFLIFMMHFNAALPPEGSSPKIDPDEVIAYYQEQQVNEGKKLNFVQRYILKRMEKKMKKAKAKAEKKGEDYKVIEKNSIGSFIAAIGGLILVLAAAILAQSIWLVIAIFGIGSAVALILGFKGLTNFRRNPDAYWGKGFAIAGIAMGSLGIIYFFLGLFLCLAESC